MRTLSLLLSLAATLAVGGTSTSASFTVRSSDYGRILFDGSGKALYAFGRDGRGRSRCSGECARRWPPFLVKSRPSAGARTPRTGLTSRCRVRRWRDTDTLVVPPSPHPLRPSACDRAGY